MYHGTCKSQGLACGCWIGSWRPGRRHHGLDLTSLNDLTSLDESRPDCLLCETSMLSRLQCFHLTRSIDIIETSPNRAAVATWRVSWRQGARQRYISTTDMAVPPTSVFSPAEFNQLLVHSANHLRQPLCLSQNRPSGEPEPGSAFNGERFILWRSKKW